MERAPQGQEAYDEDALYVYPPHPTGSRLIDFGAWFPLTSPRRLLRLADDLPPVAFAAFVLGESILLGVVVGLAASVVHRLYHVLGWAT